MNIAQFHYGEDGTNSTKIESQQYDISAMTDDDIRKEFGLIGVDLTAVLAEGVDRGDESKLDKYVDDLGIAALETNPEFKGKTQDITKRTEGYVKDLLVRIRIRLINDPTFIDWEKSADEINIRRVELDNPIHIRTTPYHNVCVHLEILYTEIGIAEVTIDNINTYLRSKKPLMNRLATVHPVQYR
jgi:hypothetical protein